MRRLISHAGGDTGTVYGLRGKPYLRQRIAGFNQAARHAPWVILVDLDNDADCAAVLRAEWLPNPAPELCFRIALREVETWLLADREAAADPPPRAEAYSTLAVFHRDRDGADSRSEALPDRPAVPFAVPMPPPYVDPLDRLAIITAGGTP